MDDFLAGAHPPGRGRHARMGRTNRLLRLGPSAPTSELIAIDPDGRHAEQATSGSSWTTPPCRPHLIAGPRLGVGVTRGEAELPVLPFGAWAPVGGVPSAGGASPGS